jgi:transposase-like protein
MRYRPISEEMKANIADDLAVGCTYSEIADRYGVSYSTIKRIKDKLPVSTSTEQKESPETVSTPIEPVLEDVTSSGNPADTNIIPEVPENVKPDDYSPYNPAVDDAVLERIERLRDKIADLQLEMSNYETELNVLEEFHLKYMEAQNNERSNENC